MKLVLKTFLAVIFIHCMNILGYGQSKKVVVDKIIATVGNRIILQSEIKNQIDDAKRNDYEIPPNAECMLMEQSLISKIMALQAEKDSLLVTEDELEAKLDLRVREYLQRFGTIEALEEVAGKSVYKIKADAKEGVKEQLLAENMSNKIVGNLKVTPAEVKDFFNQIPKDSIPYYESEFEIGQIIKYPLPDKEIENYIIGELSKYKQQADSKTVDFMELQTRHSEDEGTKQGGGKLQLNRNDKNFDPTFLRTAFKLKTGEVSAPFKSKFGYHIIYMISKTGDDAVVSHILRIPPITEAEIKMASQSLDTVRSLLITKNIVFNEAASKYSDEESVKNFGAFILNPNGSPYVTIDQLSPEIVTQIGKLKVGEITQPISFSERGKKGVKLIYLKSKSEPHRMNLKDDYSKISIRALEQKKATTLNKWIREKAPTYYINLDDAIKLDCSRIRELLGLP